MQKILNKTNTCFLLKNLFYKLHPQSQIKLLTVSTIYIFIAEHLRVIEFLQTNPDGLPINGLAEYTGTIM